MPNCGSQVILCGLPIRFDTYTGCTHLCKYCFAQKKTELNTVGTGETAKALLSFIQGNRNKETNWCDWDIPLHWGGVSDPFQPYELKARNSLECLKVFAETKYPFVVSTKGKAIILPEYLELLKQCNCVVQISMACSSYDVLEPGAPTFEERLNMVRELSKVVKRVIIRIQPYMCEVFEEIKGNLKRFAEAGAYGVIVEGMKFLKKKPGLEKVGGDYVYPLNTLKKQFLEIKREAHRKNLKFYCGENRLRGLGDSLTCCGIDGLEGFKPNEFNLCHILNGCNPDIPTAMKEPGTANCFSSIFQSTLGHRMLKSRSLYEQMGIYYQSKREYFHELFGIKEE